MVDELRRAHARRASLSRWRTPGDPALDKAAEDLAAAAVDARIQAIVDDAPPLTAAQVTKLRALLGPMPDTSTTEKAA